MTPRPMDIAYVVAVAALIALAIYLTLGGSR